MPNTAKAPSVSDEISDLQDVVRNIDGLSYENFSLIESIAGLAMCRLEHGLEHPWQLEELYNALRAIRGSAQDAQDGINGEVESVGCQHQNRISITQQNYFVGAKS